MTTPQHSTDPSVPTASSSPVTQGFQVITPRKNKNPAANHGDSGDDHCSSEGEEAPIFEQKKTRRGKDSKKRNDRKRQRVKKKADAAHWALAALESVGQPVSDRPLDQLSSKEKIKLAKPHLLLPEDKRKESDCHAHITCLDLDQWVAHWTKMYKIKDPTKLFVRKRKGGVTEAELREHGFKFLTYGTVYAFRKEGEETVLVFLVQFYPLKRPEGRNNPLTQSELQDLGFLALWLHRLKESGMPITTNKAHKGTGQYGIMHGQGWRAGSDKGFRLGLYAMRKLVLDWVAHQQGMRDIARIYSNFFQKIAPDAHKSAAEFMRKYDLPALDEITYDPKGKPRPPSKGTGCSIYVSHSNFYNEPHRDNDISPVTFGIWLTTRESDQRIEEDADRIAAHIRGGQFFFPDYGVAIDFNHCGGIACVTWRASQDRHATAFTETVKSNEGYMRWGSSIQVGEKTANAAKNVKTQGGDVRDSEAYTSGRKGTGFGIQRGK